MDKVAVRTHQENIVTLLLRYNADPNATNQKFETPISIAVETKDQDIVDILKPETQHMVREKLRRIRLSMLEESMSHELLDIVASFTPHHDSDDESSDSDSKDSEFSSDSDSKEIRFNKAVANEVKEPTKSKESKLAQLRGISAAAVLLSTEKYSQHSLRVLNGLSSTNGSDGSNISDIELESGSGTRHNGNGEVQSSLWIGVLNISVLHSFVSVHFICGFGNIYICD